MDRKSCERVEATQTNSSDEKSRCSFSIPEHPSTSALIDVVKTGNKSFASFYDEVLKPIVKLPVESELNIPERWLPAWSKLREATGLQDSEFNLFMRDCIIDLNCQIPDKRDELSDAGKQTA